MRQRNATLVLAALIVVGLVAFCSAAGAIKVESGDRPTATARPVVRIQPSAPVAVSPVAATATPAVHTTPRPTASQVATPAHPTAQPAAAYASGGLGLPSAAWEQQHGAPNEGSASAGTANYEQNKYIVAFWGGAVWTVLRQAGNGNTLTLAVMRTEAHAMLPKDAKLLKTFSEPNVLGGVDNMVELFSSTSLVARYPADSKIGSISWGDNMAPGTLSILYDSAGIGWTMGAGYSP